MKRDMELIKALLLALEENNAIQDVDGYSSEQIEYHAALLSDAGLIVSETYRDPQLSATVLLRQRMTWSGHEFLDAARSKSLWERAKKITLEKTGALSFEVLKSVLIELAKAAVKDVS